MQETQKHPGEHKLGLMMVKERLITEAQLNTAMDFQKAVGGSLPEVILRLKFVDEAAVQRFLDRQLDSKPDAGRAEPRPSPPTPAAGPVEEQGEQSVESISLLKVNPRREDGRGKRAPKPVKDGAGAGSEVTGEEEWYSAESSVLLDALLRILVRKGLVGSDEIKEELHRMQSVE